MNIGMEPGNEFSNLLSRTASSSTSDDAIVTPSRSECDENTTIHANTVTVNASLDSSPSVKKEYKKKESQ